MPAETISFARVTVGAAKASMQRNADLLVNG